VKNVENVNVVVHYYIGKKGCESLTFFRRLSKKIVCHLCRLTCASMWQIGFNKGDGVHGYHHPNSLSSSALNMRSNSNINVRGRWLYRVDQNPNPNSCGKCCLRAVQCYNFYKDYSILIILHGQGSSRSGVHLCILGHG